MSTLICYLSFILLILNSTSASASAAAESAFPDLPEVAQGTDVHTLSRTYCKQLWAAINAPAFLAYESRESERFAAIFQDSVRELSILIERIKETPTSKNAEELAAAPAAERASYIQALCKSALTLDGSLITNVEPVNIELIMEEHEDSLRTLHGHCEFFEGSSYASLKTAVDNLGKIGKHKGGSDLDSETCAHVNEILVYTWQKAKSDPKQHLMSFLIGLLDAAPTCIQGYSVRMLCAIHPPKQKA